MSQIRSYVLAYFDWYLQHRCSDKEQDEFHRIRRRLQQNELALIEGSEAYYDPAIGPYMYRAFRFGRHRAVFGYDAHQDLIRFVDCHPYERQKRHE